MSDAACVDDAVGEAVFSVVPIVEDAGEGAADVDAAEGVVDARESSAKSGSVGRTQAERTRALTSNTCLSMAVSEVNIERVRLQVQVGRVW